LEIISVFVNFVPLLQIRRQLMDQVFLTLVYLKYKTMKEGIHPEYKEVVFQDTTSDFKFITRSTMSSNETIKWEDGKTYPLIKIEVSSASHPFYTGKKIYVDTAGRVEKFNRRYKSK
jgi:large subunit ribosomal protein L31